MIIKDLRRYIEAELIEIYNQQEAESISFLILEHLYNINKTEIILKYHDFVEDTIIVQKVNSILEKLKTNMPVQYVLGETEFYDLRIKVNKNVLIPRQETELLVDLIIKENKNRKKLKIIDIGTGSGCIAIALKKVFSFADVTAVDISKKALKTAKENAELNNVKINFLEFDILNQTINFNTKFDIIVSNPPYVKESEKEKMIKTVLDFEPHSALFVSDNDALIFYEKICEFAKNNLSPKGQLWFEINENHGDDIKNLMRKFNFSNIKIIKDFQNKNRFVFGIINFKADSN